MTEKNKGGRPKVDVDWETLNELCNIQCTGVECASVLGIHYDTLNEKIKEKGYPGFPEYLKVHGGSGKASLRRAQWKSALGGNAPMMIWLGKQYLDQTDKPIEEDQNEKADPVQVIINTYDASRSPSKPTTE